MACEIPSINENLDTIKSIFESVKSIAVVGLSPNPSKDSHKVASYLKNVGYKIVPIYPKEDTILEEKVYRSLKEIPSKIDMVVIFRKPQAVLPIVKEAIERGDVKAIWMQKEIVNNEAATLAKKYNIKVVQNRCTMVDHKSLFEEN